MRWTELRAAYIQAARLGHKFMMMTVPLKRTPYPGDRVRIPDVGIGKVVSGPTFTGAWIVEVPIATIKRALRRAFTRVEP